MRKNEKEKERDCKCGTKLMKVIFTAFCVEFVVVVCLFVCVFVLRYRTKWLIDNEMTLQATKNTHIQLNLRFQLIRWFQIIDLKNINFLFFFFLSLFNYLNIMFRFVSNSNASLLSLKIVKLSLLVCISIDI